jgi:hypothetical protein
MHVKKYTNIPSPVRRVHAGPILALVVLLIWTAVGAPVGALAAKDSSLDRAVAAEDTFEVIEIKKDGWMAAGQTAGLNVLIWSFNRYIREGGNNPGFRLSLDTWRENIHNGFEWDDNSFNTNQFAHPYHGNLYFNAARSNGFGYWGSLPFAFGGSWMWEYLMENHHPSYNDWIATAVGGAAIGESTHRLSALIWDNTARGSGRVWREVGGFVVNPMGGLNRLISGQSGKVFANPEEKYPSALRSRMEFGGRTISEVGSADPDTTRGYLRVQFTYGNPFAGDYEKPFETFDFNLQLNFGDKTALGVAQVKGLLFATELKNTETSQHLLGVSQHFDYINNFAYEVGGQSFGATYLGRMGTEKSAFVGVLHANAVVMAGSKSDYPDFTGRSYSYGPGTALKMKLGWHRNNKPVLTFGHASTWLFVVNGVPGTHYVAMSDLRLDLQPLEHWGLGAQYLVYHAERQYDDFENVSQVNPEARLFVNYVAF